MLGYRFVAELRDQELDALLAADSERAWRVFVDRYTPTLLALIERAGIVDRDEAMDLYVLVCERLSEDDCGRLRRRDASRGSLEGWLAVVVRNVAVDWVRSRAGRRRLFGAVKRLTLFDQRGNIVAVNDDAQVINGTQETKDSKIISTLPAGKYFICLQDAHDRGGPAHPYRLTVTLDDA